MSVKPKSISFAILTISDTCTLHPDDDKSGPLLVNLVSNGETGAILQGYVTCRDIVPDDELKIADILMKWCDNNLANVILTTGGTGFSTRDVTPEATKRVIQKEAQSISFAMLASSLQITPMAMLSRAVCGIREKTLIINLPGSPKAVEECLNIIVSVIPHAVNLITGRNIKEHNIIQPRLMHQCQHSTSHAHSIDVNVAGRIRQSPFPMISMQDAETIIKEQIQNYVRSVENVKLWDAYGRILGTDVCSLCDLPPFRASVKDGYAVIAKEGAGRRIVLGGITAGQTPGTIKLQPGTCVRVNTGSSIPDEATAIVQVEDTKLTETYTETKEEKEIEILVAPKEGQDIRPIGSDIQRGTSVFEKGTKLTAVELGILAACGYMTISVVVPPRIGILSTGNELQQPGEVPKLGHVYDSNKITLMILLKERGYNPIDFGIVVDDKPSVVNIIKEALSRVDILITTGSVSMGEKDILKPILQQEFQAKIHFGRVNMKPGKPTTFATCTYENKKKYLLCLPGNPVSATVTAHLFVLPLLDGLSGCTAKPVIVKAKLAFSYELSERPDYVRTYLSWEVSPDMPEAYITGDQISSKLLSFKKANALLMIPEKSPEKNMMRKGDIVSAILLGFNKKYC